MRRIIVVLILLVMMIVLNALKLPGEQLGNPLTLAAIGFVLLAWIAVPFLAVRLGRARVSRGSDA